MEPISDNFTKNFLLVPIWKQRFGSSL